MEEAIAATEQIRKLESTLSTATEIASSAMCQWTSGHVSLSMNRVVEISLEEATDFTELDDDMLTMVIFNIDGKFGGQMLLTFDDHNGRELALSLIGKAGSTQGSQWTALEQSAIQETGNILASSYLSELSRIIESPLTPSAPEFVQDFGASVLGQGIMTQAMFNDRVIICRTQFEFDKRQVNWNVYFLPEPELIECLSTKLQGGEIDQ